MVKLDPATPNTVSGDGSYPLAIVGEASYIPAFERICGPRKYEGESFTTWAHLYAEDNNPYGPRAVRVEINGLTVGHLERRDARAYRKRVLPLLTPVGACCAAAWIKGGWKRGTDLGHYGVWLDIPLHAAK